MYDRINKFDIWTVEIHWHANIPDGVRPVPVDLGGWFREEREAKEQGRPIYPGLYSVASIDFSNPPSRQELVAALNHLPWAASSYKDNLIPALESKSNQFPIVSAGKKAASAKLLGPSGREVGRIEVRRRSVISNAGYSRDFFVFEERNKVACGYKGNAGRRERVQSLLYENENRIHEEVLDSGPDHSSAVVLRVIKGIVKRFLPKE